MTLEIIKAPMCTVTVKLENGELETGMASAADVGQIVTVVGMGKSGGPTDFTGEVIEVLSRRQ